MTKHIGALFLIFLAATAGWMILSGVLAARTQQSQGQQAAALGGLWGPPQSQAAPTFGMSGAHTSADLPIESSRINVAFDLEQRQKGLLWFDTYRVDFTGAYSVIGPGTGKRIDFLLPYPAQGAVYDNVSVALNGKPVGFSTSGSGIGAALRVPSGQRATITVAYRSQGTGDWSYCFASSNGRLRDFALTMTTNFQAVDFPAQTLPPTTERQRGDGWSLEWRYADLIAGQSIGMVMPQPTQPGPVATNITAWAPLSLAFYFFIVFIICAIRRIDLHPMNYLFLAASFFAFHLLFAYTVDRIPLALAFAICSVVSMALTISYLRLVVNWRFAAVEAALAQFFYLILFSLALFDPGFSGLAITVGAILTLFVTMQLTARLDWARLFDQRKAPPAIQQSAPS